MMVKDYCPKCQRITPQFQPLDARDENKCAYCGSSVIFSRVADPTPLTPAGEAAQAKCCQRQKEKKEPAESDPVFRPAHYTQWKAIEPFTFLMLNGVQFAEGCVCKYVLRWRQKDGIRDLKKARRIIDMIIELEEHGEDYTPKKGAL